jgi:hypothetical protein
MLDCLVETYPSFVGDAGTAHDNAFERFGWIYLAFLDVCRRRRRHATQLL